MQPTTTQPQQQLDLEDGAVCSDVGAVQPAAKATSHAMMSLQPSLLYMHVVIYLLSNLPSHLSNTMQGHCTISDLSHAVACNPVLCYIAYSLRLLIFPCVHVCMVCYVHINVYIIVRGWVCKCMYTLYAKSI